MAVPGSGYVLLIHDYWSETSCLVDSKHYKLHIASKSWYTIYEDHDDYFWVKLYLLILSGKLGGALYYSLSGLSLRAIYGNKVNEEYTNSHRISIVWHQNKIKSY